MNLKFRKAFAVVDKYGKIMGPGKAGKLFVSNHKSTCEQQILELHDGVQKNNEPMVKPIYIIMQD